MGKTASELWDLLHELAPLVPVGFVELHEKVQSALDDGVNFGVSTTWWRVEEWDGIQVKWQTLKRRCAKNQAERLRQQYGCTGKKVRIVEVVQHETDLSAAATTESAEPK